MQVRINIDFGSFNTVLYDECFVPQASSPPVTNYSSTQYVPILIELNQNNDYIS